MFADLGGEQGLVYAVCSRSAVKERALACGTAASAQFLQILVPSPKRSFSKSHYVIAMAAMRGPRAPVEVCNSLPVRGAKKRRHVNSAQRKLLETSY